MSTVRWSRCICHLDRRRHLSIPLSRSCESGGHSASSSSSISRFGIHTSSSLSAVEATIQPKLPQAEDGSSSTSARSASSLPPATPPPPPPAASSKQSQARREIIASSAVRKTRSQLGQSKASDQTSRNDLQDNTFKVDQSLGESSPTIPHDDLLGAIRHSRQAPVVAWDNEHRDLDATPRPWEIVHEGDAGTLGSLLEVEIASLDWQVLLDELTQEQTIVLRKPESSTSAVKKGSSVSTLQVQEVAETQTASIPDRLRRSSGPKLPIGREEIPKTIKSIKTKKKSGPRKPFDPIPWVQQLKISPYIPLVDIEASEPASRPLLSRYDWRLSSPLPPRSRFEGLPPPLDIPASSWQQGANKLIGVGPVPYFSGRRIKDVESWGWKTRVPTDERGEWPAADHHRIRLDRLLTLSEQAEEAAYIEALKRSGTPEEREVYGRTVCRAQGKWLTNTYRAEEIIKMTKQEKDELSKSTGGTGSVSIWSSCLNAMLDETNGYKFKPGMMLRFTPLDTGTGPAPPPRKSPKRPQGSLLEVKDGRLVVLFEEVEMWPLGTEEYCIDIGLDDSSYHLQRAAIDNLYHDPTRQSELNARDVEAAQIALARSKAASVTIREWTLQGTAVRELIVPVLAEPTTTEPAALEAKSASEDSIPDEMAEMLAAHIHSTETLETIKPIDLTPPVVSNPSSLLSDNQLINSWIKRHQREDPMPMEGDPVLRLNVSQTRAVAMAMSESMSLIQGPPGTGKSATIVTLIHLLKSHFRIPQPILLCAPTHVSVDHLLSLLIDAGMNPLRTGKASRVREELRPWTIEQRREEHPLWERCEGARQAAEKLKAECEALQEGLDSNDEDQVDAIAQVDEMHKKEWRRFVVLEQRLYSSLLATADVFCSTTVGAGASKIMGMIDYPIVFVDEAAMCTEPVSLIPLMKGGQHVCFIGDQKQLPAVVTSRVAVNEGLHVSLFERMMLERNVQTTLLDTQYRMRPQISAFPNRAFYQSRLQDAPIVSKRSALPKSAYVQINPTTSKPEPCVFIAHDGMEKKFRQSTLNEGEVDVIVAVVGDLLARNPKLEASAIGIISPYASQTRLLSDTFSTGFQPGSKMIHRWGHEIAERASSVEVNTVDGYQGREKSIIILSTVRSNKANFIGFLSDRRRLNVALTRAKDLLFVVGNEKTLSFARASWSREEGGGDADRDSGVWKSFLDWYRKNGLVRRWETRKES